MQRVGGTIYALLVMVLACFLVSAALAFDAEAELDSVRQVDGEKVGGFLDGRSDDDPFYDANEELDTVQSTRLKREVEHVQTAREKQVANMNGQCTCVLVKCDTIMLTSVRIEEWVIRNGQRVDINKPTPAEERAAERRAARRAERAAERRRKQERICNAWVNNKEQDAQQFIVELSSMKSELQKEIATENALHEERQLARRAAYEAEQKLQAEQAEGAALQKAEAEKMRLAEQKRARHAETLGQCKIAWAQHRNPCGCSGLPELPAALRAAKVCDQ